MDFTLDANSIHCVIGLDVGGSKIAGGIVLFPTGNVFARKVIPTLAARGGAAVLDDALALVAELAAGARAADLVVQAIGVGVCELVDPRGSVTSDKTIAWRGVPLRERFSTIAPTVIASDVRAAALAEAQFGAGRHLDLFVYLTLGTGISYALVQAGKPYAGARGNAMLIGNSPLLMPGQDCTDRTGPMLEDIAAGPALVASYKRASGRDVSRAEEVVAAAMMGDASAARVLRQGGEALGVGVAFLVNVLDPEAIVVGGGLGAADGLYWESMIESARRSIWSDTNRDLPIVHGALGTDAAMIGAAATAWKDLSPMNKIRLAILGVGDVARRDYLPELYRLQDRLELVAVCGKSEARARAVAEQFGARAWYTDYVQMLRDPEIDAVANLTPIQLHVETTRAALQAGKHVYTEKPLASNVADASALAGTAERLHLKLVCAPCVMLFPQVQYARQLIQKNGLGEIFSARAYGHGGVPPWLGYMSDPSPFFARGGGPALDMAVYPLHALTGLLGPVKRVSAMTSRTQASFVVADGPAQGKRVPVEVDDNWHLLLDFGNGRLASVQANNCVQDSRAPQLELFGLKGTLALNLLDVSAPVEFLRAGEAWESVALPRTGREAGPDHLLGIEQLVDCIQNDSAPTLSAAHAIHVLEIIEKAALSAQAGRVEDLT